MEPESLRDAGNVSRRDLLDGLEQKLAQMTPVGSWSAIGAAAPVAGLPKMSVVALESA